MFQTEGTEGEWGSDREVRVKEAVKISPCLAVGRQSHQQPRAVPWYTWCRHCARGRLPLVCLSVCLSVYLVVWCRFSCCVILSVCLVVGRSFHNTQTRCTAGWFLKQCVTLLFSSSICKIILKKFMGLTFNFRSHMRSLFTYKNTISVFYIPGAGDSSYCIRRSFGSGGVWIWYRREMGGYAWGWTESYDQNHLVSRQKTKTKFTWKVHRISRSKLCGKWTERGDLISFGTWTEILTRRCLLSCIRPMIFSRLGEPTQPVAKWKMAA